VTCSVAFAAGQQGQYLALRSMLHTLTNALLLLHQSRAPKPGTLDRKTTERLLMLQLLPQAYCASLLLHAALPHVYLWSLIIPVPLT
jgi:hypothetical protein